ncbi:30S ribosomal protein S8 [Candidatus Gracilibacteria bacterium]|nr:30S ribosomal protein S8 [Candidatus Gracilibacteria bacterium]
MTDPIADLLTRIRNAQMAENPSLELPYSKEKESIANVMKKNKFLAEVKKDESGKFPVLVLTLVEKTLELKRVSRPGQRIFVKSDNIRKVLNGFGIAIISTSKGVMTGYEARKLNIGGEFLCTVS